MINEYLYGAYGSNLDTTQMRYRCPDAVSQGSLILSGFKLVFRGVADMEACDQGEIAIGLWRITEQCEAALDRYEGFPNLYRKIYQRTEQGLVMFYQMNRSGIHPPSNRYLEGIRNGYDEFQLPLELLAGSVQHSWANQTL